jgi:hypothetical protein
MSEMELVADHLLIIGQVSPSSSRRYTAGMIPRYHVTWAIRRPEPTADRRRVVEAQDAERD